jgi:hypothetical protein
MPVGIQFADASGVLGTGSADRLGRVMYQGNLAPGASVTLPWLNYDFSNFSACNGAIYFTSFPYALFDPASGLLTWNNTTKVLSNGTGASRAIVVIGFRGATVPAGGVGIVIKNSAGEIIIDNVNPNLEIVASGSIACSPWTIYSLPAEAANADAFTFLRWPLTSSICKGTARQFCTDGTFTVDYRIARVNPVYSPISGGQPGLCCIRQPDGLVLFDSKRAYARLRTMLQFESFVNTANGGTSSSSQWSHNTIPSTAFFRVDPGYRIGTRCLFIARLTTENWASFPLDTTGVLSGDQRTALGLTDFGSYPGAALGVTLVANG